MQPPRGWVSDLQAALQSEMERTQTQAFAIQWLRPGYLVLSQQGKLRDDKQRGLVGAGDVYAFVR